MQGRMNQSTVDFWTLNLPCSSVFSSWRIPTTCLDARMIGAPTIKAMCEIIHWSLDCLAKGKFPEARHDGSPWLASDSNREAWKGSNMPGKAVLLQIRSDWDWNQKVFGAPQWNELKSCCWLCAANPASLQRLLQRRTHSQRSCWQRLWTAARAWLKVKLLPRSACRKFLPVLLLGHWVHVSWDSLASL